MLINITAVVTNKNIWLCSGFYNAYMHFQFYIFSKHCDQVLKTHHIWLHLFHTVPSPPLSVSLAAVPGSPNQLSATWTPPIPKNGIITAYTVYCNTSANQVYPEQVIEPNVPTIRSVVNGMTQAVTFSTGLYPFTQYNCYVTANTSAGEGAPSQVVMIATSESGKPWLHACIFLHKALIVSYV